MQITDKNKIRKIMRYIIWDYDIDPYDLYEVVTGNKKNAAHFDSKRVLLRMIECLSWYDIINILGIDRLKDIITTDIINNIRHKNLKEKYELIRKILQGEAISFPEWSSEYRKKFKHTLLSNRWYSVK